MRLFFVIFFLLGFSNLYSQLGFCTGSKGDPIFHEDFGNGRGTGNELGAAITSYRFVKQDPYDGEYTISDNIGNQITSWHDYLPNTTISGGRALIVNADYTPGRFYRKEISGLCENNTYEFSAFLMNVYDRGSNICEGDDLPNGGIPNRVRFEIWDETNSFLIKGGDTPEITSTYSPEWEQFALTFKTEPGQEKVILKMFNIGEGGCGNDLAIDDIIFRSCGDLARVATDEGINEKIEVCPSDTPFSLKLQAESDQSVYSKQFYQWQISRNGQDWGDIPGANNENYQTSLIKESVFYRVKLAEDKINLTGSSCSVASQAFQVKILQIPAPPVSGGNVVVCENESAPALRVNVPSDESVNWYDSETGGRLLAEGTKIYFPISSGIYYAEAYKTGFNCTPGKRTAVELKINRLPDIRDEELKICPGAQIELKAGFAGFDYRWSTGSTAESIIIDSPGEYEVDIISAPDCYATKVFKVEKIEEAEISGVESEGENVQIYSEYPGEFSYSLDGVNYQDDPVFMAVEGGIYTAYIKNSEDCKIDTLEFAHIVVPVMISPNNDGYNDYFRLKGVSFFESSEIRIFDRYGKLMAAGPGEDFKWDGTLNGKDLPAGDYWYQISIAGFKPRTGNFSLLR
ncbi:hypothetical protein GCM10023115_51610 [Pontixanthobacter gangjinensis]|uniref:T9SS type B sorting domain-containing protein n=1 Tax=Christiangramia aestuarii TaxID=1028746 RepID=A0A7K1LPR1_9FLAO|nr:T9SS type B sorting domain-containing protein [Christiangramia aestuarii]MUP42743.1 T9SS type B sorting domain-containing protein [Christiangramia aestuarii]